MKKLRILAVLKEYGMTQQTLAERLGTSRQYINNIIGGRTSPSIDTLYKMAEIIGCRACELIGDYR